MALDKSIASGKEHRKPYRGSKAFSMGCRDGSCKTCLSNKTHRNRRREESSKSKEQYEK